MFMSLHFFLNTPLLFVLFCFSFMPLLIVCLRACIFLFFLFLSFCSGNFQCIDSLCDTRHSEQSGPTKQFFKRHRFTQRWFVLYKDGGACTTHVAIYSYVKTAALLKVLQGRARSLCANCKL